MHAVENRIQVHINHTTPSFNAQFFGGVNFTQNSRIIEGQMQCTKSADRKLDCSFHVFRLSSIGLIRSRFPA